MQAQENFDVPIASVGRAQRRDFLGVEAKAIFLQGDMQPLYPGHLAKPQRQFRVVDVVDLHPVAPLFLGHVARHIGGAQGGFQGGRGLRDMHQADADSGHEGPPLPHEVQALHGMAQALGNFFRHLRRAVFQQDAKLVAAQPSQGVAFAQV